MISVIPEGRLANNLFQYVFARLIHESSGLELDFSVNTQILKTPKMCGIRLSGNPILISDYFDVGRDHLVDLEKVFELSKSNPLTIRGYFQNKIYFNHKRNDVKNWLGSIPSENLRSTGIHIRKTDYKQIKWDLPNDYYDRCINLANPEDLMIFTDEPNDAYVQSLVKRGGRLIFASPEETMYLIGTCGKQIISRSTFSWWSSFLSSPQKVYYPRPTSGWWSKKDFPFKNIEVDSEEYVYVSV
jgi:hypothetical protein